MVPLKFVYRGESICLVAPNERDAIPAMIRRFGTFYEIDILERCEFFVRRLQQRNKIQGIIVDIGAYIGNHTVFFANFCPADGVIAIEASRTSFEALTRTISCNGLNNVNAYNIAVGAAHTWGTITVAEPGNLGSSRVDRSLGNGKESVRITPLDTFLESIDASGTRISLMKIDVEGMEPDVIEGARQTIARFRPVLCIEALDSAHVRKMIRVLRGFSYLIRECSGPAPTYLLTWESRIPRIVIQALNYAWLILARYGSNAMRWRYRRVIEIVLPV